MAISGPTNVSAVLLHQGKPMRIRECEFLTSKPLHELRYGDEFLASKRLNSEIRHLIDKRKKLERPLLIVPT